MLFASTLARFVGVQVLMARAIIYPGLKKWELLAVVTKRLTGCNPNEPGFSVELAYATRHVESIHAPPAILTRAASLHPTDPTIQVKLACRRIRRSRSER